MLIRYKIPKTILWAINLFIIFLLIFTFFRLAAYLSFKPENFPVADAIPSFILGLRYDLRWISIVLLPMILVSLMPELSPFHSEFNKRTWTWYLAIMTFFIFFFFGADFGNFAYNHTRLNASALNFVEDAKISLSMLWQTYPMIWLVLALVIAVIFFRWLYKRSHIYVVNKTDGLGIPYRRRWFFVVALVLGLFIYGTISFPPLNWNRAFVFQDNFKSYLALNPLQNFFTTLKFRRPVNNESTVRRYHDEMTNLLQLPPTNKFSYKREVLPGSNSLESHPNIVLVLCESFSMYKSTMSGNPLNTTPYFNQLTKEGIFFERCFTPHFSTARGLFATLTGIPDVQLSKFSTRVPESQEQHTIINNFEGYDKFYFLGGSPGFNNFVGLLNNIDSLQMFTEGSLKSAPMNVWGVSDKNLFLEANEHFSRQQKPFFAIIQTANNHRPFMIPEEDSDFEIMTVPIDTLELYGFESLEEYNAFRYSDYCFKKFMDKASGEKYFANTIFVFVGDHGVSGDASKVYPEVWTSQRLTDMHVPLLFYAPHLLKPELRSEVVSQVDVLPTVASMVHQPYINSTLGRNLLHPGKKNNYAFIISHDEGKIGLVSDNYLFTQNINFKSEQLFPVKKNMISLTTEQRDSIKTQMSKYTIAYYETAKWMLKNNKK